jgi:pimeloyl-ACP methyl ester carboxylesterase
VFCALMSRPWFVRGIYPLFSRQYMRPRTAADRRARASAIAITRTAAGVAAVAGIWRSFNRPEHDLRSQAGKITAPAVLVWGRHDPNLPLRVAETARDLIPGSRLVVIDSGHLPHTTSPAVVAAELASLASTAFDGGSRTNHTQNRTPAAKEQQQ